LSALDSIIKWAAEDTPAWMSDAVRRLLTFSELTDNDRQDLLSMVLNAHGLSAYATINVPPLRVSLGQVSGAPVVRSNVTLKALKDLRSINMISDGSFIPFGHAGLTVIYGENGSGKSGYARVLKRACRARDTKETILPNIFDEGSVLPAAATIVYCQDEGLDKEYRWQDGIASPDILMNVTVFDSKCARVIVDEKNDIIYLPYGAHVFEELARLMSWLRAQLGSLAPDPSLPSYSDIAMDTTTGRSVNEITHATTEDELTSLANWTLIDSERLIAVANQIALAELNDPAKVVLSTRSLVQRIKHLRDYVFELVHNLSDDAVTAHNLLVVQVNEAENAVKILSIEGLDDEPLSGAGQTAWEMLYQAAKEYSVAQAYPSLDFPFVGDASRCVFCMQLLDEEGKDRLSRFRTFVDQETKVKLRAAEVLLQSVIEVVNKLVMHPAAGACNDTIAEITQLNATAAKSTKTYLDELIIRHAQVLLQLDRQVVNEFQTLSTNPTIELDKLIDTLERDAVSAEKNSQPEQMASLKLEKAELAARQSYFTNLLSFLKYKTALHAKYNFDQAIAALDTTQITRKGKSIIKDALTPNLNEMIQAELLALGAQQIPLNIRPIGVAGETHHKLGLDGVRSGLNPDLSNVLSEGEVRVVALAGFLSEVISGDHSCPIILDDPVSSLDHRYRRTVAARLAREAERRQVIIFTHDIAFLLDLQSNAESTQVGFNALTVSCQSYVVGLSQKGLPWHAMPVVNRIESLRERLKSFQALYTDDQNAYDCKAAITYSLLREAWETAIEEVLLNKVIVRHSSDIKTQSLREVEVTTDQYKTIHINMSNCSKWMLGHAMSTASNVHRPSPSDFLRDMDQLQEFVKACKKARSRIDEERKLAISVDRPAIG